MIKPSASSYFIRRRTILNEDAPYMPVYFYVSTHLIKPYVKGWQSNIMDRNLSRYMYIWLTRRVDLLRYAIRRILGAIPTILVIITLAFVLLHAAPGGPFDSAKENSSGD